MWQHARTDPSWGPQSAIADPAHCPPGVDQAPFVRAAFAAHSGAKFTFDLREKRLFWLDDQPKCRLLFCIFRRYWRQPPEIGRKTSAYYDVRPEEPPRELCLLVGRFPGYRYRRQLCHGDGHYRPLCLWESGRACEVSSYRRTGEKQS